MPTLLQTIAQKGSSLLSPISPSLGGKGSGEAPPREHGFVKAPTVKDLFPQVDPAVDGEDCLHDCDSCTIRYPNKFKIDEEADLYGWVKGWATHLIVATGKTDWVRDVEDERGSVMEGVGKAKKPDNGRMMLSASNIPLPHEESDPYRHPTRVMLLPAFIWVKNVTPDNVGQLITHVVNAAPTTTTPMGPLASALTKTNSFTLTSMTSNESNTLKKIYSNGHASNGTDPSKLTIPASLPFATQTVPHSALILLCSQATRDARCGQSAPLLRREFERHLRPLGLYRDLQDERPGGVGIYFISHTGGHKFSANVIVYRRRSMDRWATVAAATGGEYKLNVKPATEMEDDDSWGAAQCIWLARVKPNECEGIVKYTVLQGKVIKPEWQLRGGFDRCKKLVSW